MKGSQMKNTYIITGATKGMGYVFAKSVAQLGGHMALIARDSSELKTAQTTLNKINADCLISIHATDLNDETQTKHTFEQIKTVHGGAHIKAIVCFAGAWIKSSPLPALQSLDFLDGLQANFFTVFNTVKESLQLCEDTLEGLSIITIGGTSSLWMNPDEPVMSIAKGAVAHYSRILAKQLLTQLVHVAHLVIDGPVLNERGLALNPELSKNDFIKPESVIHEIHHVINQPRDAWTFEWDIRPYTRNTKLI
jgi:short-subunit dehydrogenase